MGKFTLHRLWGNPHCAEYSTSNMQMHKCILAKAHPPQWVTLWPAFWNLNRQMRLFMTQGTSHNRYKLLPVCISMSRSKDRQDWGPPTTSPRGISCKERYKLPGSNAVQIHCYCVAFSIYITLVIKRALALSDHLLTCFSGSLDCQWTCTAGYKKESSMFNDDESTKTLKNESNKSWNVNIKASEVKHVTCGT